MLKKNLLQIFLLLVVLIISYFFFKIYFKKSNFKDKTVNGSIEYKYDKTNDKTNDKINIIKDIRYESESDNGNKYTVTAKIGELNKETPEIIFMQTVTATINLKNAALINISSKSAIFNKDTYDTQFSTNVLVLYEGHTIQSDNLDLFLQKNLALISNNITYINLNTKLQADKIEIDLLTKNSKIFMNESSKKIKILTTN